MSAQLGFLVGRPWSRGSVLPRVVARLQAERARVTIAGRARVGELASADVVVPCGLDPEGLAALAVPLDRAGVRWCNTPAATAAAWDKRACERALGAARVPRPGMVEAALWDDVVAAADGREVVVKPATRPQGRGVAFGPPLPPTPPFPGPYVVQERVPHDGLDRKLYVVGDEVRGVLRCWPWRSHEDKLGQAFVPDRALRELALRAGRALGLELYGVDVLVGPHGPVVVDVNALPGYKGVPDADVLLARYLLAAAAKREARCAH